MRTMARNVENSRLAGAREPCVCSPAQAVKSVGAAATVMVGGFGLVGAPLGLIAALAASQQAQDLTVISNNLGEPGSGLGAVLLNGQIRRAIGSFFTSNPDVGTRHADGALEVQLLPQGTLAEAIRAGGAGIGGFYTRTGVGTDLALGRETRTLDGETHIFYEALRGDIALIRAKRADRLGNLVYERTARNFNPDMATAAHHVVAEVDEIVAVGSIPAEAVVTPHLYVDCLVLAA